MPLTWNIGNTNAYKANPDSCWVETEDYGCKVTELRWDIKGFIFMGMALGIGRITEANAAEYYARCKVAEKVWSLYVATNVSEGKLENVLVTPEMVRQVIGLETNVGYESTTTWAARVAKHPHNKDKLSKEYVKALLVIEKKNYTDSLVAI